MKKMTIRLDDEATKKLSELKEKSGYTTYNRLINDLLVNTSGVAESISHKAIKLNASEEELQELRNIRNEMGAIGRNVNQIAKAYNKYRKVPEHDTIKAINKAVDIFKRKVNDYMYIKLDLIRGL